MRKYNISSDLVQVKSLQPVVYKQYDNGDALEVELFKDGEKITLTTEIVLAFFELEDNTVIQKTCNINESGNAVATLDNNVLSLGGKLKAEFTIYQDGKETTTRTIMINVEESINRNEAIETVPQWDIVSQALDLKASDGDAIAAKITTLNQAVVDKYNELSAAAQVDSEVVLARGGEVTLGQRLDKVSSSLAEKAAEITNLQTNKADKTEVNTLATGKADKTYVDSNLTTLDTKINSQASGSPKGVFATLTALQTAFPTGNTNTYVVSADGNWYYWNGSAWVVGGVYQSTMIAPYSVTSERLSLDVKTRVESFKFTSTVLESPTILGDLANYSNTLSGNTNRIWIQYNTPITKSGFVSLKIKSSKNVTTHVILLEETGVNNFKVKGKQLINLAIGENNIITDLQSSGGTVKEFIAIFDTQGSFYYNPNATGQKLHQFNSFDVNTTTTFTSTLTASGWQLALGVSVVDISIVNKGLSDLLSTLTIEGQTWGVV